MSAEIIPYLRKQIMYWKFVKNQIKSLHVLILLRYVLFFRPGPILIPQKLWAPAIISYACNFTRFEHIKQCVQKEKL